MDVKAMEDSTRELNLRGLNCVQAVLAAGLKTLAIDDDNLIKASSALSGGIASTGGPCGAFVGGVILIGRLSGKIVPEEKYHPQMWRASYELYKRFLSELAGPSKSINCRDIVHVDWRDMDQVRKFYHDERRLKCADMIGATGRILGEILIKYFPDNLTVK